MRDSASLIVLLAALRFLQIYFSKKQVDQKLLMRDGNLSWVERCRRKKDQVRARATRVGRLGACGASPFAPVPNTKPITRGDGAAGA